MVVGHKKQRESLERAIFSGNVSHALIFEGRSHLGKKDLAINIFKKINCQEKNNPCNKCQDCLSVDKEKHPDLILIEPEKNEIQIKQIRELIRKISFHSYSSPFKWVIINKAHLLNQEASNSLLKVLEEPKGKIIFFLITQYPEMIFSTVRSRAQRIKFFPLTDEEIISMLKKKECSDEVAREIALFSFGRPRIAMDFFLNEKKLELRKKKIKELAKITSPKEPFYLRFNYAKEISENREELKDTLEIWLSYLRSLLLEKARSKKVSYSFKKLKKSLELIEKTIYLTTRTNVNPRLATETLLIEL